MLLNGLMERAAFRCRGFKVPTVATTSKPSI